MNKFEKLGAKLISQITTESRFGWPPDCYGFIYQPERPVHCKDVRNDAEDKTNSPED